MADVQLKSSSPNSQEKKPTEELVASKCSEKPVLVDKPVSESPTDVEKNGVDTNVTANGSANASEKSINTSPNKDVTTNGSEDKVAPESTEEQLKKANLLFLQGKRNLIIRDYQAAVDSLGDASQILTSIYAEDADELGDVYFYYGKALLELARSESNVLVEKDKEVDDDDDDEEDEEEEAEEEEEKKVDTDEQKEDDESNKDVEMTEGEEREDEKNEDDEKKEDEKNEDDEKKEDGEEKEEGEEKEDGEKKEDKSKAEEDNEDGGDLQLSWEFFELAKIIFQRKANECKESAVKLSEVYLALGENGCESGQYGTAVEDLKKCLALQEEQFPETDRRIAETHYQLGIANSLGDNFDDAINCFNSAIEQLRKKLKQLIDAKDKSDNNKTDEVNDAFYTVDGEIKEIEGVIEEVKLKIIDMLDHKKQRKEEIMKLTGMLATPSDGAGTSSSTMAVPSSQQPESSSQPAKPVSNISHLVRKKRKNEEESTSEEKKQKLE